MNSPSSLEPILVVGLNRMFMGGYDLDCDPWPVPLFDVFFRFFGALFLFSTNQAKKEESIFCWGPFFPAKKDGSTLGVGNSPVTGSYWTRF